MDLSALDTKAVANQGAQLHLKGPDGTPLFQGEGDQKKPITLTLIGKDSDEFQMASNALANRRIQDAQRKKTALIEEIERDAIRVLASCTKAWDGIVLDGEELAHSFENVVKLYTRFPWIREQVDEFIAERANFLKASLKI